MLMDNTSLRGVPLSYVTDLPMIDKPAHHPNCAALALTEYRS